MITNCPICNGTIQATREDDLTDVVLDDEGSVIDDGHITSGTIRIYCENDHDEQEILEAIQNAPTRRRKRKDVPMRVWRICQRIKTARHAQWLWNWIDNQEQPEPLWAIMRGTVGLAPRWSMNTAMEQAAKSPQRGKYQAQGTHGFVEFDDFGMVTRREGYENVVRVDVAEFRAKYGELEDTDILDLGYWTVDGQYEPPEADFRDHLPQQADT